MKIKNNLKKALIIGGLILAEGINSPYNSGGNPTLEAGNLPAEKEFSTEYLATKHPVNEYLRMLSENYFKSFPNSTPFENAKRIHEEYKKSELEKMLKEEKESASESFYLTSDSLNTCIKQAYNNVKKFPKEFDKRLFRLLLKQESGYDIHAVSKTGYLGLGQLGPGVYETFRPEEFAKLKDSITGELDTLALQKELFNPIKNIELSLENLDFISKFCTKHDSNWKTSDLETKRKKMLFCYNAGIGTAKDYGFDWNNEDLPKENREYPEIIMKAYRNPDIKVKL